MRRSGQRVAIGADREERDITQIEQTGESDHDVQPERQHDVEHREIDDAHPAAPEQRFGDEGQEQQRDGECGE